MRDDSLIFSSCAVKRTKSTLTGASGATDRDGSLPPKVTEQKGDLLICDLLQNGIDSVHNMHVMNTDAKYHTAKKAEKCLQEEEKG